MGRLTLLLFLMTKLTYGFTLNNNIGAAFDKEEVSINVAAHTCANLGITNDELLSLAEEAGELFWNRVHTSSLILKRGALVSVATAFQTGKACTNAPASSCDINSALVVSSDILISCNTEPTNFSNSPSVLGVTVPNNFSGRTINGALILVNDNGSNSFQGLGRQEKVAVLAHEIGHAVGLGHSSLDKNLMYFQSVATRETLGWDDVDGITYLYPVEQPLSGCGTIELQDQGPGKGLLTLIFGLLLALAIGRTWQKSGRAWSTPARNC